MVRKLLRWFRKDRRPLPWRREPRKAYHVWISEIMLQQTRVDTVIPYYRRWLRRFPTVRALARAPLDDVLKAWEGLGYYRRARLMHQAAGRIVNQCGGRIPTASAELEKLPGLGRYTAAAIASLVHGENVLAVDGNVKRVAARVFAVAGKGVERRVKKKLEPLLPKGKAGLFNEALMELGALVCKPKNPRCFECPLSEDCRALAMGRVSDFPAPSAGRSIPHVDAVALVLVKDGKLFLRKRGDSGMLAGLWGFPLLKRRSVPKRRERAWERRGALEPVRHAYSHFTVSATPIVVRERAARYGEEIDEGRGAFFSPEETASLALSRLDHKILDRLKNSL